MRRFLDKRCFLAFFLLVAAPPLVLAQGTTKTERLSQPTASPTASNDINQEIWLAVNALLSSYYATSTPEDIRSRFWPRTTVINGITLDVHPGSMPTVVSARTSLSSTATRTRSNTRSRTSTRHTTRRTPTSRTSIRSTSRRTTSSDSTSVTSTSTSTTSTATQQLSTTTSASATATPRDHGSPNGHGDRSVGIGIAVALSSFAMAFLLFVLFMLRRRKKSTGNYYKPVRHSTASMQQVGQFHEGRSAGLLSTPSNRPLRTRHSQLRISGPLAPSRVASRSTIRKVPNSNPGSPGNDSIQSTRRRSVEALRQRRLVSNGAWTLSQAAELEGSPGRRSELDAGQSPILIAHNRSSNSPASSSASTPTVRPLYVTQSPTTSSSDALDSQEGSRGESLGESADDVAPIEPPAAPRYRDRRPPDLTLPMASRRFRDTGMIPVYFQGETQSRGISPLSSSTPTATHPQENRESPNTGRRRGSPMFHYPSWSERSEFDFGEVASLRRSSPEDGGDGWQPGRDSVFGRYEMA